MYNHQESDNKTFIELIAEAMQSVPDEKKEMVAAHLLGTVQGVLISAEMQKAC